MTINANVGLVGGNFSLTKAGLSGLSGAATTPSRPARPASPTRSAASIRPSKRSCPALRCRPPMW